MTGDRCQVSGVGRGVEMLDLGVIDYAEAFRVQEDILKKRINGQAPDTLIVLEHHPVVTRGRLSDDNDVLDREYFADKGIPVIRTGRGGKITYHAPGQLVLYPIVDLSEKKKDVSFYIDFLEKTVAGTLRGMGVAAGRNVRRRGVWAGGRKIAFIGIALKKWVTYHGVAVNIGNDLEPFGKIDPCGEGDIEATSVEEMLGRKIDMSMARKAFARRFAEDLRKEYGTYEDKAE